MSRKHSKAEGKVQLVNLDDDFNLSLYPVDMSSFLISLHWTLDSIGVPYHGSLVGYHPTTIAQYALAHWNQYLTTNDEYHRSVFLIQAQWLAEHEVRIDEDTGGWPIYFPHPNFHTNGSWLSALAQGSGISVVLRAYQLTHEEVFLEIAYRAACTFKRDILDGGISTPIGEDGVFFEEVAIYPASHTLNGFIFALFGLYDYVSLIHDVQIEKLIHRSIITMHRLLDEFDIGFWTRFDLLHRRLASPAQLALQAVLIEAVGKHTSCEHCKALALRWKSYLSHFSSRLGYMIISRCTSYSHALWHRIQRVLFPKFENSRCIRVCVPITGFPIAGGTRTVLAGVAQVTSGTWQIEYLTQNIGPYVEEFAIHGFGTPKMTPWQFPSVWFYFLTGFWKLISLMRHGANYHVILPQDGVFTAAFATLAAKLAGIRVVCIDHGNLTLLKSRIYRSERIQALATKSWYYRLLVSLLYICYWPSLFLLARISVRFVDHFLIPGIAGDGVEEVCKELGVQASHITRFASMIDVDRYIVLDAVSKAEIREKNGIAADAIVIAMVGRLAPEKGLDIALEGMSRTLSRVSQSLRERVRVIVVGDGPLRKHVEEEICKRGLTQNFVLWGETSAKDVISLLSLSDIFLYTSIRGACLPMAILEAMASSCAIIASALPMANEHMLAEGRGIIVPPGDEEQTTLALVRLVNDPLLCRQMGNLAREYVTKHHNPVIFRRTLMQATYWSELDTFLSGGLDKKGQIESIALEES